MIWGQLMTAQEIDNKFDYLLSGYASNGYTREDDYIEKGRISKHDRIYLSITDLFPVFYLCAVVCFILWGTRVSGIFGGLMLISVILGIILHLANRNKRFDIFFDPRNAGHVYTTRYCSVDKKWDVFHAMIAYKQERQSEEE